MISHGAGFEMRRTLGTAVFSGMLGVTLFGIFLTPVFFYTIDSLGETRLFASPAMRWSGRLLLDIASLGLLRLLPAVFRRRSPRAAAVDASVATRFDPAARVPQPHLRDAVKQK